MHTSLANITAATLSVSWEAGEKMGQ